MTIKSILLIIQTAIQSKSMHSGPRHSAKLKWPKSLVQGERGIAYRSNIGNYYCAAAESCYELVRCSFVRVAKLDLNTLNPKPETT